MSAVGSSQPQIPNKLDILPSAIKLKILGILGIKGVGNAVVVDTLWKKFSNDPGMWNKVARELNIPIKDAKNSKAEVVDYYLYHDINQVFNNYVNRNPGLQKMVSECQLEREKFDAILAQLAIDTERPGYHQVIDLLTEVVAGRQNEHAEAAVRKLIASGIVANERLFPSALNATSGAMVDPANDENVLPYNLPLFTFIVQNVKDFPGRMEILKVQMEKLAMDENSIDFLKVLVAAGVRPSARVLENAAFSVKNAQTADLDFLLSHSTEGMRKEAVEGILAFRKRVEPEEIRLGTSREEFDMHTAYLQSLITNFTAAAVDSKTKEKNEQKPSGNATGTGG